MGVAILDENGWRIESDDSETSKNAWDRSNPRPEMGDDPGFERPGYDRPGQGPQRDYRDVPQPRLEIVPVTPTVENERGKWHPGLIKTPIAPEPPQKKPVFH